MMPAKTTFKGLSWATQTLIDERLKTNKEFDVAELLDDARALLDEAEAIAEQYGEEKKLAAIQNEDFTSLVSGEELDEEEDEDEDFEDEDDEEFEDDEEEELDDDEEDEP